MITKNNNNYMIVSGFQKVGNHFKTFPKVLNKTITEPHITPRLLQDQNKERCPYYIPTCLQIHENQLKIYVCFAYPTIQTAAFNPLFLSYTQPPYLLLGSKGQIHDKLGGDHSKKFKGGGIKGLN